MTQDENHVDGKENINNNTQLIEINLDEHSQKELVDFEYYLKDNNFTL